MFYISNEKKRTCLLYLFICNINNQIGIFSFLYKAACNEYDINISFVLTQSYLHSPSLETEYSSDNLL